MKPQILLSSCLFLAITGCQGGHGALPLAQEPTADSQSYFCGMSVLEHAGPKGQVFLQGRSSPLWFGTARDAIAFTRMNDAAAVEAIYVNDMGRADWDHPQTGTWIDARKSWFVIGSRRSSGMGIAEAIPFADGNAATSFSSRWGGEVVTFSGIPGDYVLGDDSVPAPVSAANGAKP